MQWCTVQSITKCGQTEPHSWHEEKSEWIEVWYQYVHMNGWMDGCVPPGWGHVAQHTKQSSFTSLSHMPVYRVTVNKQKSLPLFTPPGGELWLYFIMYWECATLKGICFSHFLSGKGAVFRPISLARDVFWSWFGTKILARVVILPVFSGKSGKFLSGKGKGMPPWAAHPYP